MKTRLIILVILFITSLSIYASDPASKFGADYNILVSQAEGKLIQLAEAIPQDKMSWRPAEGVRSIAAVYLHVAQSTKYLLATLGEEVPEEFNADPKDFESSTTANEEIVKLLKLSFEHYKSAAAKVDEEKLNSKVNFFGNDVSVRLVLTAMHGHIHEHLGQSIAYARSIGVTPPWNAKAE